MEGCTDGTFPGTGQKFFHCPPGKGLYYPLRNLQPDERYASKNCENELRIIISFLNWHAFFTCSA